MSYRYSLPPKFISLKKSLISGFIFLNLLLGENLYIKDSKSQDFSVPVVAKLSAATVVKVWGAGASGSGVIVEMPKEDGTGTKKVLFTAYHVVSNLGPNESLEIELPNQKFIEIPSQSVRKLKNLDLAFLSLPPDLSESNKLRAVKVGNSNALSFGQQIIIAGFPIKTSSNASNQVRIKAGIIQTFSQKSEKSSLVGYDAKTVPGMSGGGVFSMDGKLLLIHLRGEKDIWESNLNIDGRPLKSGTNYGIPALLALKEAQKQALQNFDVKLPLEKFKKGLYLAQNKKYKDAHKIFKSLWETYPDSLIAEWNTKCMDMEIQYPGAQDDVFPLREQWKLAEKFEKKHSIKNVYSYFDFSDAMIWDKEERNILLSFDPILSMAKRRMMGSEIDTMGLYYGSYVNRDLRTGKCASMAGLTSYTNHWGEKVTEWEAVGIVR